MLETITSRDSPSAASQAANTSRIIGAMLASVKWLFKTVTVSMTNKDSNYSFIGVPGWLSWWNVKFLISGL